MPSDPNCNAKDAPRTVWLYTRPSTAVDHDGAVRDESVEVSQGWRIARGVADPTESRLRHVAVRQPCSAEFWNQIAEFPGFELGDPEGPGFGFHI